MKQNFRLRIKLTKNRKNAVIFAAGPGYNSFRHLSLYHEGHIRDKLPNLKNLENYRTGDMVWNISQKSDEDFLLEIIP